MVEGGGPYKRALLDSSVLLAAAKGEEGREAAHDVLSLVHSKDIELCISVVALVECRRGPKGNEKVAPEPLDIQSELEQIFASPRVVLVEVDRLIALRARKLGMEYGLRTWDAVHLASALEAEADVFFTYDLTDFKAPRFIEGVWCAEPYVPSPSLISWSTYSSTVRAPAPRTPSPR